MPKIHDDDFDRLHFNRVEANVRKVNNLYNRLIGDIVRAVSSGRIDSTRLFQFSDYPDLNKSQHSYSNPLQRTFLQRYSTK